MSGLVGIIANDSARYSLFSACIDRLKLPHGARKEWLIGGDWCGARNTLARMALDDAHEWLWFMDDDHAFSPGLLNRLLSHEKPLVVPMCLTRTYPFNNVAYVAAPPEADKKYLPIPLSKQAKDGLIELEAGGCAGMLIHAEVLKVIEPPWFEYADRSEDVIFCEKARAAGYKLYGDLGASLGHITTAVVAPVVKDGEWVTQFTIAGGMNLTIPPIDKQIEMDEAAT